MDGVDWESVDIGELGAKWQQELDDLRRDTVKALAQASNGTSVLIPALQNVQTSVHQLSATYSSYAERLQIMGKTVQVIEEINRGLLIQTHNQHSLLALLDDLLTDNNAVSDGQVDSIVKQLDNPKAVNDIYGMCVMLSERMKAINAKSELMVLLAMREKRDRLQVACSKTANVLTNYLCNVFATFAKQPRSYAVLGLSDEQVSFVRIYQPVFEGLRELDLKRYAECTATLQIHLNSHLDNALRAMIEALVKNHIVPSSCPLFSGVPSAMSLNPLPSPAFMMKALSLTGDISPLPLDQQNEDDSRSAGDYGDQRTAFNTIRLLDMSVGLPIIKQPFKISHYHATHYILLHCGHFLDSLAFLIEQSFSKDLAQKIVDNVSSFDIVVSGNFLTGRNVESIECLVAVQERLAEAQQKQLTMLGTKLERLLVHLKRQLDAFTSAQVQAIKEQRVGVKRRIGIFPYISVLPKFLSYFDRLGPASDGDGDGGRDNVDDITRMKQTILKACLKQLDTLAAREADPKDDKDQVNAAVMTIENSYYLMSLKAKRHGQDRMIDSMITECYEKSLNRYINLNCPRIFGDKLYALLTTLSQQSTSAKDLVMYRPEYGKTNMRRALAEAARDVQGGIEYVQGRVHKHFASGLATVVWDAVKKELRSRMAEWCSVVRDVYEDGTMGAFLDSVSFPD